jgi:hypothetical protein
MLHCRPDAKELSTIHMEMSDPSPSSRLRRRLGRAGIAAILALVLLWVAWWRITEHQLANRLQALRAAGEPIEPQDFVQLKLPPEENAAIQYRHAFLAEAPARYFPSNFSYIPDSGFPPRSPGWRDGVAKALVANGPALAAARKATAIQNAQWGSADAPYPTAPEGQQLVALLADGAVEAHYEGDDAEAIDRILDLLHLCGLFGIDLTDQNWAAGAEILALERLEFLLPDLDVIPSATPPKASRPVDRRKLEHLIVLLLDDRAMRMHTRQAICRERWEQLDFIDQSRGKATILRPMYAAEMARVIGQALVVQRAFDQEDLVNAQLLLGGICASTDSSASEREPERYSHLISSQFGERAVDGVQWAFKCRAERRAAAMALAIRLYRLDRGRWPATTSELIPAYLPAIPSNPLIPGDEAIRYYIMRGGLPKGGDRPILVFATSAGASIGRPPNEPAFASTQGFDKGSAWPAPAVQWRDLALWLPPDTARPTTQN